MAELRKLTDSSVVVNIVPPRHLWDSIQRIRTKHVANARCGPHLTFLDPFIALEGLAEAKALLTQAFASIPPFTIRFERFNHFKHSSSSTLYLEPTTPDRESTLPSSPPHTPADPAPLDALQELMSVALSVLPQCDDQQRKGAGKYVPHMSVGAFKKVTDMQSAQLEAEKTWKPLEFTLKEVYILTRQGSDPFELYAAVPLGGLATATPAHFGDGSYGDEDSQGSRSLVLCNIPRNTSAMNLKGELSRADIQFKDVEVLKNPDGKSRTVAVVEFNSRKELREVVGLFAERGRSRPLPYVALDPYVRPLDVMFFPLTINSSTTLKE